MAHCRVRRGVEGGDLGSGPALEVTLGDREASLGDGLGVDVSSVAGKASEGAARAGKGVGGACAT